MVIDLAEPETGKEVTNKVFNDTVTHLEYLSNTQQDDLLRKFILQERTLIQKPGVVNVQTNPAKTVKLCGITNLTLHTWLINACSRI